MISTDGYAKLTLHFSVSVVAEGHPHYHAGIDASGMSNALMNLLPLSGVVHWAQN